MTKISQFQQKIILFHDKNEVKIASALLYFNKTGFTELVMRNKWKFDEMFEKIWLFDAKRADFDPKTLKEP